MSFRQYRPLEQDEFLVAGYDLAMGGEDYSACVFISKTHTDIPLVYHAKETATISTNRILPVLESIHRQTGVKPVIAPERNAGGVFEIDRMLNSGYNTHFRMYVDRTTPAQMDTPDGKKYGFTTNSATRPKMLEELKNAIDNRLIGIYDEALVNEMFAFIVNKTISGWKAQAEQNAHDDCFVAGTPILTDKGQVPIENIKVGDKVFTRDGYKPVVMTRNKMKKVITRFGMTATPDHPFITKNRGEVGFAKLGASDILYMWNEKQSRIEEKTITDIQNQREDSTGSITGSMINGKKLLLHFTGRSGLITMGKYLRGTLFTIKMGIRQITTSRIWSFLQGVSTQSSTCEQRKDGSSQKRLVNYRLRGLKGTYGSGEKTTPKKLMKYIAATGRSTVLKTQNTLRSGRKKTPKSINRFSRKIRSIYSTMSLNMQLAFSARRSLPTQVSGEVNTALLNVQAEPLTSEGKSDYQRVYNLQVADTHEYFANNILVHNCIMAMAIAWQLYQTQSKPIDHTAQSIPQNDLSKWSIG